MANHDDVAECGTCGRNKPVAYETASDVYCADCGLPEDEPTEDTGRYQSGYRVYRDGSYREDFGSDR